MPKPRFQKLATSSSSQKTSIPSNPQKPPGPPAKPVIWDIIAYEHVELQPDEDLDTIDAKSRVSTAMESAGYGAAGERHTYGNREGVDLLEEKHNMNERLKRLDDWMANKDIEIANHQAEIATLLDRVNILTKDAEGYHDIRHRFIDVYRRDVLGDHTPETHARIHKGNATAHEGDAITDARLYTTGQRDDEHTLISLYGLTANQISLLVQARNHSRRIISVLNAGATWRTRGDNIPQDVAAAFQTFTTELTAILDRGLTNQSLTDVNTALSRARRAFWNAHYNHR